jgi:uncharacterized protein (DUF1778 family)
VADSTTKTKPDNVSATMNIRVTEEELQLIEQAAAKAERKRSDYCRRALMRSVREDLGIAAPSEASDLK